MGHGTIKRAICDQKFVFLFAYLLLLLMSVQLGSAARGKQINCRKYVLAPECRGIAAKRDTTHLTSDDRYFPEDRDTNDLERALNNNALPSRNFLSDLLKRAMERNLDYDTGANNYVK